MFHGMDEHLIDKYEDKIEGYWINHVKTKQQANNFKRFKNLLDSPALSRNPHLYEDIVDNSKKNLLNANFYIGKQFSQEFIKDNEVFINFEYLLSFSKIDENTAEFVINNYGKSKDEKFKLLELILLYQSYSENFWYKYFYLFSPFEFEKLSLTQKLSNKFIEDSSSKLYYSKLIRNKNIDVNFVKSFYKNKLTHMSLNELKEKTKTFSRISNYIFKNVVLDSNCIPYLLSENNDDYSATNYKGIILEIDYVRKAKKCIECLDFLVFEESDVTDQLINYYLDIESDKLSELTIDNNIYDFYLFDKLHEIDSDFISQLLENQVEFNTNLNISETDILESKIPMQYFRYGRFTSKWLIENLESLKGKKQYTHLKMNEHTKDIIEKLEMLS